MLEKSLDLYQTAGCSPQESELGNLEGDVSIQCLQSSEFVVGKQHNFNGPVTIISCAEISPPGEDNQRNTEKIIIKDKLLTKPMTEEKENEKSTECGKQEGKKEKWRKSLEKLKNNVKIPVIASVGILIVISIGLGCFFVIVQPEEPARIGTHAFYTKKDWGGKPPKSTVEMKLPVPYVFVSHTVTPVCDSLKHCSPLLRNMQDYHLSIDFADISDNFLVDIKGNIYEGRGWTKRNIAGGFVNGRSLSVAFFGDYSQEAIPSEGLLDGLKQLLEYGVENGKISINYSLLAANSTAATLSPGKNVYAIIKNWPHFDPDPKSHVKEYDV